MKLTHDIHTHTHLSICGKEDATISYYVQSAKELGLKTVGIADHMWDAKIPFAPGFSHSLSAGPTGESVINWYRAQDIPHCRQILKEIQETDTQGIIFLFGGEVDYAPGIGPAITEGEAEKLDFMVVPNSHTHHVMDKSLYEPYERHGEFMVRAAMEICTSPLSRYVTSLAHPFDPVCCPYPEEYVIDAIPEHQFREVFCAAKEHGIAAEINSSCFQKMSPEEIQNNWMFHVLSIAKSCGCTFTFGSDSHSKGAQASLPQCLRVAELLGLTEQDLHPLVR